MKLRLDPASAVPLYHQIVEAVRYRIATGRLVPGETLLTVREAASRWEVNLHTVRRAYKDLVDAGFVESRPGRGTRVLAAPGRRGARAGRLDEFLSRVLAEARDAHDLSADDLAALLANWTTGAAGAGESSVFVLECSENQCRAHVREIEERWDVDAKPWSLEQQGDPPGGALVATYFHFNEIRRRWPQRLSEIRFATIRPAAGLVDELRALVAGKARARVPLCEFDDTIARNIAADVSALLPARGFTIVPTVVDEAAELLTPRRRTPVLFSPRAWGRLSDMERAHPFALEVRYTFPPDELDAIGHHFHWSRILPTERRRGRRAYATR